VGRQPLRIKPRGHWVRTPSSNRLYYRRSANRRGEGARLQRR